MNKWNVKLHFAYIRPPKMRYLSVNLTKHIIDLHKANMTDEKNQRLSTTTENRYMYN